MCSGCHPPDALKELVVLSGVEGKRADILKIAGLDHVFVVVLESEVFPGDVARFDLDQQCYGAASDVGAGVIVAGAYGHSRFREWVFGGVTRYLMTQRKRCFLLSR